MCGLMGKRLRGKAQTFGKKLPAPVALFARGEGIHRLKPRILNRFEARQGQGGQRGHGNVGRSQRPVSAQARRRSAEKKEENSKENKAARAEAVAASVEDV